MPSITTREQLGDLALTAVLMVLGVVAVYGAEASSTVGSSNPEGLIEATPVGILVVLVGIAPVAVRRRWPFETLLATATVYGVTAFTDRLDRLPLLVPVLICFYTVAVRVDDPRRRRASEVVAGVVALLSVSVGLRWHGSDWFEWIRDGGLELLSFVAAWTLGDTVRRRDAAQRQLAERTTIAEEHAVHATAHERARIARELHDLVGHAISVISVQATVGEHLAATDPEAARSALGTIHEMSQQAMTEMRHLVGVLREDGDGDGAELTPQPGLVDVDGLLTEARAAGTDAVLVTVGGPVPISPGVGLAAYRVVQEALTNARKHAPGAPVGLTVEYGADALTVRVVNGPPGTAGGAPTGGTVAELGSSGFGLVAMRERVAVYHGTLDAGPEPDGGFHVIAHLPYDDALA